MPEPEGFKAISRWLSEERATPPDPHPKKRPDPGRGRSIALRELCPSAELPATIPAFCGTRFTVGDRAWVDGVAPSRHGKNKHAQRHFHTRRRLRRRQKPQFARVAIEHPATSTPPVMSAVPRPTSTEIPLQSFPANSSSDQRRSRCQTRPSDLPLMEIHTALAARPADHRILLPAERPY